MIAYSCPIGLTGESEGVMKPELLQIIKDAENHAIDLQERLRRLYAMALEAQNQNYEANLIKMGGVKRREEKINEEN